jgi:hypothetical protein
MKPEPKEIIDLANQILAAEETVKRLRLKWDSYFSGTVSSPSKAIRPIRRKAAGRAIQPDSLQGSITLAMEAEPFKTFTAAYFSEKLNADINKVRNTLARLAYKGKIHSNTKGVYSASEHPVESAA